MKHGAWVYEDLGGSCLGGCLWLDGHEKKGGITVGKKKEVVADEVNGIFTYDSPKFHVFQLSGKIGGHDVVGSLYVDKAVKGTPPNVDIKLIGKGSKEWKGLAKELMNEAKGSLAIKIKKSLGS